MNCDPKKIRSIKLFGCIWKPFFSARYAIVSFWKCEAFSCMGILFRWRLPDSELYQRNMFCLCIYLDTIINFEVFYHFSAYNTSIKYYLPMLSPKSCWLDISWQYPTSTPAIRYIQERSRFIISFERCYIFVCLKY